MNKFLIQGKNWDCTINWDCTTYLGNEGSFMDISFKRIICAAALAAALLLVSAPAANAAEYGEVGVAKTWDADSGELPESVTVRLLSGDREVSRLTLTAADASVNGSWQGSFKNVPLYNDDGTPISYTVEELPVEGFSSEVVRQPKAESVAASSWGRKVTPASQRSYSIGSSNLVVAKKGGSYYVWTDRALSAGQQSRLLTVINSARLQGLGKALSTSNTEFASGLPVTMANGAVSFRLDGGETYIDFGRTSAWSLFYAGTLEISDAQGAVIANVRRAEPTEEPTPTAEPTEEPTPTAEPTEEPTPTAAPTDEPAPSAAPSEEPTPSSAPTDEPAPTATPAPSSVPTEEPVPSTEPSVSPSPAPKTADRRDLGLLFTIMCAAAVATLCGLWKLKDNW